jgi:hypothetical protein
MNTTTSVDRESFAACIARAVEYETFALAHERDGDRMSAMRAWAWANHWRCAAAGARRK